MTITRKHLNELAAIIKDAKTRLKESGYTQLPMYTPEQVITKLEGDIIMFCKQGNRAFDEQRFRKACN